VRQRRPSNTAQLTAHLFLGDATSQWIQGLQLADSNFTRCGRIDVPVGVYFIQQISEIRRGTQEDCFRTSD